MADKLLLAQISVDVRDIQKQMQRAGLSVDTASRRMAQTWRTNTSAMARDTEQFGRDVRRAITAIGLTAAAGEITSLADAWTRAGNQISAASAATGAAGASLSTIANIARDTRVEFESTATLYARLTRATGELGASQAQVIEATRLINQAFVAGGSSAQEQASAVLQLSQALQSGVLQGDELRSLRESSPLLLAAIAKEFGVAQGALKQLGAEGKLTSDRIFTAILKAAPEIEAQFSVTQATVADSFTNLRTAAIEYVGQLDSSVGATASLSGVVNALADNFEAFADSLVTAIYLLGARGIGGAINSLVFGAANYARTMRERNRETIEALQAERDQHLDTARAAGDALNSQRQGIAELEKERARLQKTVDSGPKLFAQYGELKVLTDKLAAAEANYNAVLQRKGATEAQITAALEARNRAQAELNALQERAFANARRLDALDKEIAARTGAMEKTQRRLAMAQSAAARSASQLAAQLGGPLVRAGQSVLNFFGGPIGIAMIGIAAAFGHFQAKAVAADRAARSMAGALDILARANLSGALLTDIAADASEELTEKLKNQKAAAEALEAIERRRLQNDYLKGIKDAREQVKELERQTKSLTKSLEEQRAFGGDTNTLEKYFLDANSELADTVKYLAILESGLKSLTDANFKMGEVGSDLPGAATAGLGVSSENPLAGDLKNIRSGIEGQIKAAEDAAKENERIIEQIRETWAEFYLYRDEQIKADLARELKAINASGASAVAKAELRKKAEENAAAKMRELHAEEMEAAEEDRKASEEAAARELDLLAQIQNERDRMLGRFLSISAREYEARRADIYASIKDAERRNAALAALAAEEAEFKRLAREEALNLDDRSDPESQIAAVREAEELKLEYLREVRALQLIEEEEFEARRQEIIKDSEAEILAIRKDSHAMQLDAASSLFGGLANLARSFAGESSGIFKALFLAEKAFALASAYVQMQLAIAKANASAPPPLNAGAILKAKITGAAAIAGILASTVAGFKKGGYTGDGNPNDPAGIVHKGEFVVPARAVKQLGRANLEALRFGKMPSPGSLPAPVPAAGGRSVTFGDVIMNISGNGAAEIRDELAAALAAHRRQIARDVDRNFGRTLAREVKTTTPRHERDR